VSGESLFTQAKFMPLGSALENSPIILGLWTKKGDDKFSKG